MRRAIVLAIAGVATGCGSGERQPERPRTEQLQLPAVADTPDEIPPWSFGVRFPDSPDSFASHEAWEAWRRRTWPPACAAIETRMVEGRVLPETRRCREITLMGYIPVALLVSRGILRTDNGATYDVVWTWDSTPRDDGRACDFDPVRSQRGPWKLQRNAPERLWQMTMPGDKRLGDSDWADAQCRMVLEGKPG